MGLYFTKCINCGRMWWFRSGDFSTGDFSTGGEPCNCDIKYHKECTIDGKLLKTM